MSEKTPENVRVFRELLTIFPGARFLFCVRDPRAVTASLLEVAERAREKGIPTPPIATRNISTAIRTIKTYNTAGFDAVKLSDKVLTVVYERLVTNPEEETKRICNFLGVPWSEETLRPGEREHDGGKLLRVVTGEEYGVWYDEKMYYSNPDPSRVNKWEKQLTPTQKAMLVRAFGEDEKLAALGYRFSEEDLPMAQLAAGRAQYVVSEVVNSGLSLLFTHAIKAPAVKNIGMRLLSRAREAR
jgi:hypothetical protein